MIKVIEMTTSQLIIALARGMSRPHGISIQDVADEIDRRLPKPKFSMGVLVYPTDGDFHAQD